MVGGSTASSTTYSRKLIMGVSTVSGPFRSQNGFEELVNGVWVPVTGGGGGGGSTVIFREANNITYQLPMPTEVGQVYNLIVPRTGPGMPDPSGNLTITLPIFGAATTAYMTGYTVIFSTSTPCTLLGQSTSSTNAIRLFDNSVDISAQLQIVFLGNISNYSLYEVVSSSIRSSDTGSDRIIQV
jgi:hypothetical protein